VRATLEGFLRRAWTGRLGWAERGLALGLIPPSWVWRGVAAARDRRYRGSRAESVPGLTVVSVGNLAVGGTGKTPLTSWIARWYVEAGQRPAILLSGYGDDERRLHERWTPQVRVFVDRDRVEAARRARAEGADVAVLDDGFQHRRLNRDLDVVLLAAEDRFPGYLLPRGPYREVPEALERADAVLVTRRTAAVDEARRVAGSVEAYVPAGATGCVHLSDGVWRDLGGRPPDKTPDDVLAVAAVARPDGFKASAQALLPGSVELVTFPDHHAYTRREVQRLRKRAGRRPIVMTEKDAVKLVAYRDVLGEAYVLEQRVTWDWGEREVVELLAGIVGVEAH
jgi:tetraacyldisaccharide 4'-kinase